MFFQSKKCMGWVIGDEWLMIIPEYRKWNRKKLREVTRFAGSIINLMHQNQVFLLSSLTVFFVHWSCFLGGCSRIFSRRCSIPGFGPRCNTFQSRLSAQMNRLKFFLISCKFWLRLVAILNSFSVRPCQHHSLILVNDQTDHSTIKNRCSLAFVKNDLSYELCRYCRIADICRYCRYELNRLIK